MVKVEVNGIGGVGLLLTIGGLATYAIQTAKENKKLKAENRTLDKALDLYEMANEALSRELDEYEKKFGKLKCEEEEES